MKNEPLVVERILTAPARRVWQALTDNNKMKQWYFDIAGFKPEPGFEFRFYGGDEQKKYLHFCKVVEVIPEKKLSYTWRYADYPGESLVSFELFEEDNKTRVRITHTGLESFVTDNPDFARESFSGGWTHILGTSLKEFVEKENEKNVSV